MVKKNSSIINQTVYKVSILFLFAFIIMTIAISQLFFRTMQARIVEDQQLIVSQNVDRVNVTFEGLIRPIITLASSQSCVKLLNDYNELYSVEWMKNIREMDEFLENVLLFHDFILDVTLIQTDSNVVYSRKDLMRKDFDYVNAEWFEKAMSIDGLLKYALPDNKEHYYNEIGKNYTTTIIYPVKNKEIIRGYILFEIDLTRVSPLFKEGNSDGYTGYLTVSHDGKIISDYRRSRKNAKVISEDLYEYIISKTQKPKLIDNKLYISNVLSSTD